MANNVVFENGKFYRCCRLYNDNEYGMQEMCDVKCKNFSFPIYATLVDGELREIVTGLKLQLVSLERHKFEYSCRSYEELKALKPGYFYINAVFEVSKEKVAQDLHSMERNDLVQLFKNNLLDEHQFHQERVSFWLSRKTTENNENQYAISNADKIIQKYLS